MARDGGKVEILDYFDCFTLTNLICVVIFILIVFCKFPYGVNSFFWVNSYSFVLSCVCLFEILVPTVYVIMIILLIILIKCGKANVYYDAIINIS